MNVSRWRFLAALGANALTLTRFPRGNWLTTKRGAAMYGLIGKVTAVEGQRDALAAILLAGTEAMPGCLSYIVASDPTDPNGLWITEVWDSLENHRASLTLPAVKAAIAQGRPLIAGFSNRVETVPLGGSGLPKPPGQ